MSVHVTQVELSVSSAYTLKIVAFLEYAHVEMLRFHNALIELCFPETQIKVSCFHNIHVQNCCSFTINKNNCVFTAHR